MSKVGGPFNVEMRTYKGLAVRDEGLGKDSPSGSTKCRWQPLGKRIAWLRSGQPTLAPRP